MSFDVTNPAHLSLLKGEQNTDPIGMGYSAVNGETKKTLELFNKAINNVGAETIVHPVEDLDIPDIAGAIDGVQYTALSEYDKEWVKSVIRQRSDIPLLPYKAKFLALFPSGTTFDAVVILLTQPASRAEILFGVNTIISKFDWTAARDS